MSIQRGTQLDSQAGPDKSKGQEAGPTTVVGRRASGVTGEDWAALGRGSMDILSLLAWADHGQGISG